MGAVTYPDATVAALLNEKFVPVQVNVAKVPKLVEKFQVLWTPNLNFLNDKEKQVYHVEGWLSPSECAAMLMVAEGHYQLHRKKFDQAGAHFRAVFDRYPQSEFAPEALYYLGVSRYLASHEAARLAEEWQRCQQFYPESTWARRSMVL
ncbi:MAG: thioredoxin [Desulfobacteraceae bacterium]|nr:MAG: thioredoxin [Desulfobacteraceae bacterium]